MTDQIVTEAEARRARGWLEQWAVAYREEVPSRIHASHHGQAYGLGSAPPFAPEFIAYMGKLNCKDRHCRQCREDLPVYIEGHQYREEHSDARTRVSRALRKLRRAAPLEFDVVYMALRGATVAEIADRLTERAIARGKTDRYDVNAVTVLVVLGVDKVGAWM